MHKTRIFKTIKIDPPGHSLTYEYDYFVWIQSSDFQKIFGKLRKLKRKGRRNHIKISYGKKSIYRTVETAGHKGVTSGTVGLSYNSLSDLGCDPKNPAAAELKIRPAWGWECLLFHPDSSLRIPFWATIISFVLGVVLSAVIG